MLMDKDKIRGSLDEINDIVCSCRNGKNGYISEIDLMNIQSLLYDVYSECEQSNNAQKSIELKPCPFCGKTDTAKIMTVAECLCLDNPTEWNKTHYGVVCDNIIGGCGASTGLYHESPEKAAEAWNIRASDLIPCSERMPEKDGAYLCVSNGEFKILPYRNGEFYCTCFDAAMRCCNSSVTRWMPLPDTTKGV